MKIKFLSLLVIAASIGFSSCNSDSKTTKTQTDTTAKVETPAKIDLMVLSEKIMKSIKEKDFETFASYVHPTEGVRFSATSIIDVEKDKVLTKDKIIELSKTKKKFKWGVDEGIGDPINLNITKYFDQFVYDVDFAKLAKKELNKVTNSVEPTRTIKNVYPKSDFVEYFYAGDGNKHDGLDWKALTLIFKNENNNAYLIGISHRQWAP
jgi:hypothetical protein